MFPYAYHTNMYDATSVQYTQTLSTTDQTNQTAPPHQYIHVAPISYDASDVWCTYNCFAVNFSFCVSSAVRTMILRIEKKTTSHMPWSEANAPLTHNLMGHEHHYSIGLLFVDQRDASTVWCIYFFANVKPLIFIENCNGLLRLGMKVIFNLIRKQMPVLFVDRKFLWIWIES